MNEFWTIMSIFAITVSLPAYLRLCEHPDRLPHRLPRLSARSRSIAGHLPERLANTFGRSADDGADL